jgi:hypothetical protein
VPDNIQTRKTIFGFHAMSDLPEFALQHPEGTYHPMNGPDLVTYQRIPMNAVWYQENIPGFARPVVSLMEGKR